MIVEKIKLSATEIHFLMQRIEKLTCEIQDELEQARPDWGRIKINKASVKNISKWITEDINSKTNQ